MIIFDIETGPIEDQDLILALTKPASVPEMPVPFDPNEVKVGNMKDPEKIRIKLEEAASKRQREIEDYQKNCDEILSQWKDSAIKGAALSAVTGRVLAIGYKSANGTVLGFIDGDKCEAGILSDFWAQYEKSRRANRKMVGHNILNFDLPFLAQRSWVNGVDVPESAIAQDKFWDARVFVDTMKRWAAGKYGPDGSIKLDTLDRVFGFGGKSEGMTGADFSRMFLGSEDERKEALEYLQKDLEVTYEVAVMLGIS